jgi:hypothetical protein
MKDIRLKINTLRNVLKARQVLEPYALYVLAQVIGN